MKIGDFAEVLEGSAKGFVFKIIGFIGDYILGETFNYKASLCKKWEPNRNDDKLIWFWNSDSEYPMIGKFIEYASVNNKFIADIGYPIKGIMHYSWEFCEPFTRGIPDIKGNK